VIIFVVVVVVDYLVDVDFHFLVYYKENHSLFQNVIV
jgi:hypothetical protein